MKKVILIISCATLMILSFSSCNKKCKCKVYLNGVVQTENLVEIEKGKKCKDLSAFIQTPSGKTGQVCK